MESDPTLKSINKPVSVERLNPQSSNYDDKREEIMDSEPVWVDWDGGDLDDMASKGFKHAGPESYLISPISDQNFFSDKYMDCTAVLAMATDVQSGKEVAFLSHQDPRFFINKTAAAAEKFSGDLKASLEEIKIGAKEGTLDISILGGNYDKADPDSVASVNYRKSIEFLGALIKKEMGIDPKVLTGPNILIGSGTDVMVETQTHTVIIDRADQPPELEVSYLASELANVEKTWLATV